MFFSDSSVCRLCVLQKEYNELKKKIRVLQDFVTPKVRVLPPIFFFTTDQSLNYTVVAVLSNQATVSVPFTSVRRVDCQNNNKQFLLIATCNRLNVLAEKEEEDHEKRLLSDSIVREQLHKFCCRARTTRKKLCMPGERLDNITTACEETASMPGPNT